MRSRCAQSGRGHRWGIEGGHRPYQRLRALRISWPQGSTTCASSEATTTSSSRRFATAADHEGYSYPLVTLRLGVAYHQALADECEAIARDLRRAGSRSRRSKAS